MADELVRTLEDLLERRYGKYRGIAANQPPTKTGELWVMVPSLFGQKPILATPCVPFAGPKNTGMYFLPEPGTHVWVEFEEGDTARPVWTGMFWLADPEVPVDPVSQGPARRVLQTPSGHCLEFDDRSGSKTVRLRHANGAELVLSEDGSVLLSNSSGMKLSLDKNKGEALLEDAQGNHLRMKSTSWSAEDPRGNRIEMAGTSITVRATGSVVVDSPNVSLGGHTGEPVIKGLSFLMMYAAHTHSGATTPPLPQPLMSTLSQRVTTT